MRFLLAPETRASSSGRGAPRTYPRCEAQRIAELEVEAPNEGTLGEAEGIGGLVNEAPGEGFGLVVEAVARADPVQQAPVEGLAGGYGLAGQDQVEGAAAADGARQGLGAAGGGDVGE